MNTRRLNSGGPGIHPLESVPRARSNHMPRRPDWDSTINNVSAFKASNDEIERRKVRSLSKNKLNGKTDVYSRLYGKCSKDSKELMKGIFCDEASLREALAKSDKAIAMVEDLFGDTAKLTRKKLAQIVTKYRGLPRVTQAPSRYSLCQEDEIEHPTKRHIQSARPHRDSASRRRSNSSAYEENEEDEPTGRRRLVATAENKDGYRRSVTVSLPREEPEMKTNLDHVSAAMTRAVALNDSSPSEDYSSQDDQDNNNNDYHDNRSSRRHQHSRTADTNQTSRKTHRLKPSNWVDGGLSVQRQSSARRRNGSGSTVEGGGEVKGTDDLRRFREFVAREKLRDNEEERVRQEVKATCHDPDCACTVRKPNVNDTDGDPQKHPKSHHPKHDCAPGEKCVPPSFHSSNTPSNHPNCPSSTGDRSPIEAAQEALAAASVLRSTNNQNTQEATPRKLSGCYSSSSGNHVPGTTRCCHGDKVACCSKNEVVHNTDRDSTVGQWGYQLPPLAQKVPSSGEVASGTNSVDMLKAIVNLIERQTTPGNSTGKQSEAEGLVERLAAAIMKVSNSKEMSTNSLKSEIKRLSQLVDVLTMELMTANEKINFLTQRFSELKEDTDVEIARLKTCVSTNMISSLRPERFHGRPASVANNRRSPQDSSWLDIPERPHTRTMGPAEARAVLYQQQASADSEDGSHGGRGNPNSSNPSILDLDRLAFESRRRAEEEREETDARRRDAEDKANLELHHKREAEIAEAERELERLRKQVEDEEADVRLRQKFIDEEKAKLGLIDNEKSSAVADGVASGVLDAPVEETVNEDETKEVSSHSNGHEASVNSERDEVVQKTKSSSMAKEYSSHDFTTCSGVEADIDERALDHLSSMMLQGSDQSDPEGEPDITPNSTTEDGEKSRTTAQLYQSMSTKLNQESNHDLATQRIGGLLKLPVPKIKIISQE